MAERATIVAKDNGKAKASQPAERDQTTSSYFSAATFRGGVLRRKVACVCGGGCPSCSAQSNSLAISQPTDVAEIEADQVADQVMLKSTHPLDSGAPPRIHRYGGQPAGQTDSPAPASVVRVLASPGIPLEPVLRQDMEHRFGHDFSSVRVHSDGAAEQSAEDVNADAYTVGHHIVFGADRFSPQTHKGQRLLAHELTHTLGEAGDSGASAERISDGIYPAEHEAEWAAGDPMPRRPTDSTTAASGRTLHRQTKSAANEESKEEEGDVVPAKDIFAGTMITEIIISLSRKRVGFRWAMGMILGTVNTDLKPGKYELKPDVGSQKWVIEKPVVKSGLRFDVKLEGALPWTLSYPETVPLTVVAGAKEPKPTDEFDPQLDLADPLLLYEGWPDDPRLKPISGIDDFESTARYDFSYRSDKGNLSKWVKVFYRDNTVKDINIDSITEATPKLWAVRREVLIAMDNYNSMFILQFGFPTVFMIITINPLGISGAGKGVKYTATRRTFSKVNGEEIFEPQVNAGESSAKSGEPVPKTVPKVDEVVPNESVPKAGEPTTPTADSQSVIDASSKVVPRSDGTFRLNRKNFSHPEKVIGEPESVVPEAEAANREAVAAELAASKPNVEKVYVGKAADEFINGSIQKELSADVVAVTKEGKFYVYEAGGSDVSPLKLSQLEHTSRQLGSGSVLRQTFVMKGKLTTPGYTVENGVLMSGGRRVMVDGKPVYIKFTTQ